MNSLELSQRFTHVQILKGEKSMRTYQRLISNQDCMCGAKAGEFHRLNCGYEICAPCAYEHGNYFPLVDHENSYKYKP